VSVFIRQLTGVRFVAAAWVLLYHLQGPLDNVGLLAIPVIPDVLNVGRLGVDLFFALSGFILTHTYLSRLGQRARLRETLNFWWLRLARVYPVHLVMLVVAGLALFAQAKVTGDSLDRAWLNPLDFIRNLLLIQEWGPEPQRGWNFVAWSLSMEWLAYLIFPILILVIWRCNKRLGLPMLIVLWFACITPLVGYGLSRTDSYYTDNWGSTIRILTEFTAGAITYLIVRRLLPEGSDDPGRRTLQGANALSWLLPLAVVAGSVLLANLAIAQPPITLNTSGDAEPMPPYFHLLLVPFLIAWLGALALARGRVSRGLATKTLVLGGFISYSLYMTHLVVFGLWRAGMRAAGIDSGVLYAAGLLVLVAAALAIAWLMWRFVEEPAREWMRGRAGVRRAPTEEAGEAIAERLDSGAEPVSLPGEPGSTPQGNPGAKPEATP
jgi:peptidoglycan/LPS O-acetylase OafA/YrhL